MGHGDEVRSVVDDEVGLHVENGVEVGVVLLIALEFLSINFQTEFLAESGCHRIIGGQGVAASEPNLGSGVGEGDCQHSGLGLGVEGHSDLQTSEGLLLPELLVDLLDHGHVFVRPVETHASFLDEFVHLNSP